MIRSVTIKCIPEASKPRASGDDPDVVEGSALVVE